MAGAGTRRIRVSRPAGAAADEAGPADRIPTARRSNPAATQRVRRLALLFVVGIAALYLAFALAARHASSGASAGTTADLEIFGALALVIAFVGAFLTLLSAPAVVEIAPAEVAVVGPLGHRRSFAIGPSYSVRVVRRYRAGLLSSAPVDSVEIRSGATHGTYLLDAGTLDPGDGEAR